MISGLGVDDVGALVLELFGVQNVHLGAMVGGGRPEHGLVVRPCVVIVGDVEDAGEAETHHGLGGVVGGAVSFDQVDVVVQSGVNGLVDELLGDALASVGGVGGQNADVQILAHVAEPGEEVALLVQPLEEAKDELELGVGTVVFASRT